ncbi:MULTISPECIES: flagellar hook assembly protein FlgD [unclassified Methylobacterium]|jgi:flagellar basal-body rod modification protein FlgD|uniref:flagellar hook assembly protein FlgD n=1 Tax=unclassified Methylobacterium TaxID=2615210 RepID=UPI0006FA2A0D|nr:MULTISPECIES: flagellar hook capping FlgD N-terminal domain-containing protein [unclassified Methylobacterium]KQO52119.1 flagellar hook capping protein [Methylobacterium sp. Leaf86]KQO98960.1 flagellar hook capping protein [Methylobacterium sp. Leaf91]
MTSGITGASSSSSITNPNTATGASQEIAGNFQQFLTLLTTQLKNQNPMDPLDTNQFTQQLVQYAGVEQQLKSNDRLDSILNNAKASSAAAATGFIGQSVTADGRVANLKDGSAVWTLTPARAAKQATMTISDAKGNVVATQSKALTAGAQTFAWDGRSTSGFTSANGSYSIKIDAFDATGAQVSVDTQVAGKVDGVDLSGTEPVLLIGNSRLPISSVQNIGAGLST